MRAWMNHKHKHAHSPCSIQRCSSPVDDVTWGEAAQLRSPQQLRVNGKDGVRWVVAAIAAQRCSSEAGVLARSIEGVDTHMRIVTI